MMKDFLNDMFKGIAMGVANVIPGVSGGTIALITGIFERLINALKAFDIKALKMLLKGRFKEFALHTDLVFLFAVFLGIFIAILSIARLFEFLFLHYPVYIWAFFFGLILASVYFVGKTIHHWKRAVYIALVLGTAFAIALTYLNPATENDSFLYLIICGVVAICSMILPGLSGSFVLLLMGNYQLVMIESVNNLQIEILFPVAIGAVGGLLAFSHLLSWIFKRYRDITIATLTGFILGSLSILWPWSEPEYLTDAQGEFILKKGEKIITGYSNYLPDTFNTEVGLAIFFVISGIVIIWVTEMLAARTQKKSEA
jgi:putative membrane protein